MCNIIAFDFDNTIIIGDVELSFLLHSIGVEAIGVTSEQAAMQVKGIEDMRKQGELRFRDKERTKELIEKRIASGGDVAITSKNDYGFAVTEALKDLGLSDDTLEKIVVVSGGERIYKNLAVITGKGEFVKEVILDPEQSVDGKNHHIAVAKNYLALRDAGLDNKEIAAKMHDKVFDYNADINTVGFANNVLLFDDLKENRDPLLEIGGIAPNVGHPKKNPDFYSRALQSALMNIGFSPKSFVKQLEAEKAAQSQVSAQIGG